MYAIRYLIFNRGYESFDSLNSDNGNKECLLNLLIRFLQLNYDPIMNMSERDDEDEIAINEKIEILRHILIINYIQQFYIEFYSSISYEFNSILIQKTSFVKLIYQILQNKKVHEFLCTSSRLISDYYSRIIESSYSILKYILYFYNHFKQEFNLFTTEVLFNLSITLQDFFGFSNEVFYNMIPFALNYEDDNEEETHKHLWNIFENRGSIRVSELLSQVNTSTDIIKSRKAINLFLIDFFEFSDIKNCDDDILTKFIKLSIQFIKYAHENLIEDLTNFIDNNMIYGLEVVRIIRNSILTYNFDQAIQYFSGQSDQFCYHFFEDVSENGIKVMLDHLCDNKILSILLKYEKISLIHYVKQKIYNSFYYSLYNLSKASYNYKKKWRDLNACSILLSLCENINHDLRIVCFMTIANIATEDELKRATESSNILNIVTKKLKEFSKLLSDKSKTLKRAFYRIDKNYVEIITIKGFNLVEILQTLYKFSINDDIKAKMFEIFKFKESIKTIVYHGNEIEQEYAFKLINQFCFDKTIAMDIKIDRQFLKLLKDISLKIDEKHHIYVESILWLMNERLEIQDLAINEDDLFKHIFISFHETNKSECLQIALFLESLGYKVWIDVENNSSIKDVSQHIQLSWCVIILMSDIYKENNKCRHEAEICLRLKKSIVPVTLQNSFKSDGW
jgi:hypothetical protein